MSYSTKSTGLPVELPEDLPSLSDSIRDLHSALIEARRARKRMGRKGNLLIPCGIAIILWAFSFLLMSVPFYDRGHPYALEIAVLGTFSFLAFGLMTYRVCLWTAMAYRRIDFFEKQYNAMRSTFQTAVDLESVIRSSNG